MTIIDKITIFCYDISKTKPSVELLAVNILRFFYTFYRILVLFEVLITEVPLRPIVYLESITNSAKNVV